MTNTVADYMTTKLVTVGPELEIIKAMRILLEHDVSGAPVVDSDGRLVGILSSRDCMRVAFNASYHQEWGGTVAEYMTASVETIDAATDVVAASHRFVNSRYRRFPVPFGSWTSIRVRSAANRSARLGRGR